MTEFAIIKTGGKQYKVKVGDVLKVEKLTLPNDKKESKIEFADLLENKKVSAEILGSGKHPKVRIFKFKPKKRYKRDKGHRQEFSQIKITKVA